MNPLASPTWRALRSSVVAAVTALISAAGHALGGGGVPSLAVLLVGAIVVAVTLSGWAKWSFRAGPLFALMAVMQGAYHALFSLTAMPMSAGSTTDLAMPMDGMTAVGLHAMQPVAGSPDVSSPLVMIAFHVLAALLCAVALAGVDQTLFLLTAPLRLIRLLSIRPAPPAERLVWSPTDVAAVVLRCLPAEAPWRRRGPPIGMSYS